MLLKSYSWHPYLAFNFEHEHTSNDSQDIAFTTGSQIHKNVFRVKILESENKHNSIKMLTGIQIMSQTFMRLAQWILKIFFL